MSRSCPALFLGMLGLILAGCTAATDVGPPVEEFDVIEGAGHACSDGALPLAREMSSGARWSLCFDVDPKRGAVLSDIGFDPGTGVVPVIAELSLAQLEVPYDTGERLTSDITSAGFGGTRMKTLSEVECPQTRIGFDVPAIGDGSTFGEIHHRDILCSEVADAGLAYRSEEDGVVEAKRSDRWQLWTVSKVGWYEYLSRYTFEADGSIIPEVGATGDLSPVDYADNPDHGWAVGPGDSDHAASHSHNAVWRIHWSLGDGAQRVEQYDNQATGGWGSEAPVLEGTLTPLRRPTIARQADRRWWRVVAETENDDRHPISYEIDIGATDSFTFVRDEAAHGAGVGYDIAFTNADDCQIFATANRGGCGTGLLDFVERGKKALLSDVVSWVAVGYHHVPRDEDQSPMELHWQGFTLRPRDLTAQRVDLPGSRSDLNGQPKTWNGELVDELE